ncbi:uncharacterized protein LOC112597987 [Melanaphis sacchari]|uniref:uncharacterized protein LOC112597987 n=1 Tax=Melanaphis sacchari TaxID=742174 RepID=UPI000DC148DA|nr:uncharacterized protein LOC112597987 [Melanaphis sacchari]
MSTLPPDTCHSPLKSKKQQFRSSIYDIDNSINNMITQIYSALIYDRYEQIIVVLLGPKLRNSSTILRLLEFCCWLLHSASVTVYRLPSTGHRRLTTGFRGSLLDQVLLV